MISGMFKCCFAIHSIAVLKCSKMAGLLPSGLFQSGASVVVHIYNVCLLHDFVATLRLSALPSALYFILSKLAL